MNTNTYMSPKDFFLHLGATVALYASAIAIINLAFEIMNRLLPDVLSNYWSSSSIAWPISMMIVLIPILYILENLINRDIKKNIEKKDVWVRRWRIYLTLFLSGVTIAVDVITLIYTYLNGEISSRFIWKVLIILLISAVIFTYYILSKNAVGKGSKKLWLKILAIVGIVISLIAIIAGFVIVGSPNTQRSLRFDSQRVTDLSNIQWQIVTYWQRTGNMPSSLNDLLDPISSLQIPIDPKTGKQYEYVSMNKDPLSFGLCATFDLASNFKNNAVSSQTQPVKTMVNDGLNYGWDHPVGYYCFEKKIDPKLYPPASAVEKAI